MLSFFIKLYEKIYNKMFNKKWTLKSYDGYESIIQAARRGDPDAQARACMFIALGDKLGPDWEKLKQYQAQADGWLKASLSKGDAVARHVAARLLLKSDPAQAFYLTTKSAEQGWSGAQNELAKIYRNGIPGVVSTDPKKSFYWIKKAAYNGSHLAQHNLLIHYAQGIGTPHGVPDLDKAVELQINYAKQGNKIMQDALDKAGIEWRNEKSKTSIKTKIKEYVIVGIILFILSALGLVGQSSDLLISSSHSGGEWLASFFITLGADVNAENNRFTALMWAARDNPNLGFFRVLIDEGADINAKSLDGATPLKLAVLANPNPEVARLLIDAGADVSEKDVLLYYASKNENFNDTDYNLLKEKILAIEKTGKEKGKQ